MKIKNLQAGQKCFNQETTQLFAQLFAFHEKLETFYFGQLVFFKFHSKK